MDTIRALLWLIPLLPFAGAALNGVLGRKAPKALVTLIGLGAPLVSLVLALVCLWQFQGLPVEQRHVERALYHWSTGDFNVDFAFLLDPLSAVMLFVVTFVGFF